MNIETLPDRIFESEALKIARFSRSTMQTRQKDGLFPQPIDFVGQRRIYRKSEVLKSLGLAQDSIVENPFEKALDAYRPS